MILTSQHNSGKASWILFNRMRWNKDLIGAKNGVNKDFVVPGGEKFIQSGEIVIRVFRNGQRLRLGASEDYTVSESGGAGTGYDTVTFVGLAPDTLENLTADYMIP